SALLPTLPCSTLFPYTTLFRSLLAAQDSGDINPGKAKAVGQVRRIGHQEPCPRPLGIGADRRFSGRNDERRDARDLREHVRFARDRKSTRLNSSHVAISYAVFC